MLEPSAAATPGSNSRVRIRPALVALLAVLVAAGCVGGGASPSLISGVDPRHGRFQGSTGAVSLVLNVREYVALPGDPSAWSDTTAFIRVSCVTPGSSGNWLDDRTPIIDGRFEYDASYMGIMLAGRFSAPTQAEIVISPSHIRGRVCAVNSDEPAGDVELSAVWGAASADVAVFLRLSGNTRTAAGIWEPGEELVFEYEQGVFGPLDSAGCTSALILDDATFTNLFSSGHGSDLVASESGVSLDQDFGAQLRVEKESRQIMGPTYQASGSGRAVQGYGSEIRVSYEVTAPGRPDADFFIAAEARTVFPDKASAPAGSDRVYIEPDMTELDHALDEAVTFIEQSTACN